MVFIRSMLLGGLAATAMAAPSSLAKRGTCADVTGDFTIENYMLYPENLDWDPVNCKFYIGSNFNATVMVYDPYTSTYDILDFTGISGNTDFHVSGIDYDAVTKSVLVSANSGAPFVTSGSNMTGANYILRIDAATQKMTDQIDLAPFTDALVLGGETGGGIQDMAEDDDGNSYIPTVFHVPAIAKVTTDGAVSSWYIGEPTNTTSYVYLGVVYHSATKKLIVTAPYLGVFQTFDVSASTPAPVNVTMNGRPADGSYPGLECDGLLNPARYGRSVLLCSEDGLQAITLWSTADDWASVTYIGQVVDNSTTDIATYGSPTATVETANSIYLSNEYFHDLDEFDVAGTRSSYPMVDITSQLDALVEAAGISIVA